MLNYAVGLTRVRLRHFVAGSLIGGAPRVLAYTALGGAAAERALWPAVAAVALLTLLGVGRHGRGAPPAHRGAAARGSLSAAP